jgi:predicted ATPase
VAVDDLHSYEAMELFVAAATNADIEFRVTEGNVNKIAEICKHLDGNALAIKLAASLAPTLSVDEISARLRERFEVLVQGRRQALPRHRTLKAAIDWSYDLLSPDEAAVFRRLAVFAGSWSLKAAESVCVGEDINQSACLKRCESTRDSSLKVRANSSTSSKSTRNTL